MSNTSYRGIFTIPATPFDEKWAVDWDGLRNIVDFCVECGAHGLVWPVTIAPFDVHIVSLAGRDASGQVAETAERLYHDLRSAGLDVLFDDRPESPGVKFNDADLIGLPLRVTVSERALAQGGVEFKRRDQAEKTIVPVLEANTQAQAVLAALREAVEAKVVVMP